MPGSIPLWTYHEKLGIALEAWYPLANMNKKLMNEPVLIDLANHYHKSKVQIILRWHFQKGNILIPGSRKEEHILANKDIFDFELTKEDMESISKLNKNKKFLGFPSWLSKLLLPRLRFNFDKQK